MTILVTGATGYTGGRLVRALRARNENVRALIRCSPDAPQAKALASLGVELFQGDIRDASAVSRAARGCRTIYHIAAVFRTAGHSRNYYCNVNVGGTRNVVAAAWRRNISRLVHCSTVGVHGDVAPEFIPASETAPFNPGDIYQRTKLEGEQIVQRAIADGLPATIFRPSGIYGPKDLRFLKLFRSINNGSFRMFGSGKALYHLTYIDDLIDGIIRCGECEVARGQIYILAGREYTSLSELVLRIAHALGVAPPPGRLPLWPLLATASVCEILCVPLGIDPPLYRRRVDFFRKDRAFCIGKARDELGFNPTVELDTGLARTAAWYFEKQYLHPQPNCASPATTNEPM